MPCTPGYELDGRELLAAVCRFCCHLSEFPLKTSLLAIFGRRSVCPPLRMKGKAKESYEKCFVHLLGLIPIEIFLTILLMLSPEGVGALHERQHAFGSGPIRIALL